jgi:clathrin heavy chain
MDKPIVSSELFQLNNVQGGLRPNTISFKTLTLESDKFVCVRDVQADGQCSLVVVDLEQRTSERHNIKDAESAIMNPNSRILALRSRENLQVFNIDARERLKACAFNDTIVFWKWVDERTVGIVTNTAVYHWVLDGVVDAMPTHMFDRSQEMDAQVQILNYKADADKKWLMLSGVARAADNSMAGKTQLYSVENSASKVLDGSAGTFASIRISPTDPRNCNVMCLASNNAPSGRVLMMELPTGSKTDLSLQRKLLDVQFTTPGDFPVALSISPRHKLLTVVSRCGQAFLFDIWGGELITSEQVTPNIVFCGTNYQKTGGIVAVSNQGAVFHISVNDNGITPFIKTQLRNPELALRIASSANLGGVDELFRAQLNQLLEQGNYEEAARVCFRAPNNVLRTRETLNRFSMAQQLPGQPAPMSTYFKVMLAETKLNSAESVELARAVVPKGGAGYVKQQFEEDKIVVTEELAEIMAPVDPETAMKMFYKIEAHPRVVNLMLSRNDAQKAVAYCKRVNFTPDWRVVINNFVRVNPQEAVGLALMLHRDMGPSPVLDPHDVVDMFVTAHHVQQATQFLLEILQGHDTEENGKLQTKLLEINIKHSNPTVAEKIFAGNVCSHYDGMVLAPLCERAGLFQRAIECYIKAQFAAHSEIDNLASIRRCLSQAQNFNAEWLIDFFGKLNQQDSLLCLQDLLTNHRQHFKVIVQVATKYSDALGSGNLIHMFLEKDLFDILYYYLGAISPYTRDPEVHFRYIEAAAEVGQLTELERMTRESPCYDAERTKNYLKAKKLTDLWPLINVCDIHNFIPELVRYLIDTNNMPMIEQFVQRRSPSKTPAVVGTLLDCNAEEGFIKNILNAAGTMCPVETLVEEVESRGRLRLIQDWLEARKNEKKTDVALHNALAKIYVDIGQNVENFLETNDFYDPLIVGKYCENRDPGYSYIAYKKGHCNDEIIELTTKNGMWKQLARHLVKEQNLDLWAQVLKDNTPHRQQLVEAVQQTALPESKVSDEVSCAVRAFMNADMTHELTALLDQIVVHGEFRKNRFLENLLIMSAIRARRDKVMEYVNNLQDYDAQDIANIATGAELHEVAYTVYDKHNFKKEAITVLVQDLKDMPRARSYAAKADLPAVWTVLGQYLLQDHEVSEAIDALIRAKNPDFVEQVSAAAERVNQYGDLIKYLSMARRESKSKDSKIDTFIVLTYAKTGRLADLEEFLKDTHGVQVLSVADKCFADGLYDSARVLYTAASNFPKLALTLIKLKNLQGAVEAAVRAQSIKTWKEVVVACLEANEVKLANQCAVPLVIQAEELPGVVRLYEQMALWEDLLGVLKSAATAQGAHMGIFTELGVLLAQYKPEKLLDHVNMYPKKINTHKMIAACEKYHHWNVLRVLHVGNEDWLAATGAMMQHVDAWDHEVFKDVTSHLGSSDIVYSAITFYVVNHPDLLMDFLSSVFKKVDAERVMNEVSKNAPLFVIRPFLEAAQDRNNKRVNESLNAMYIEEEDFAALRKSVDSFNNFDSADLSAKLEKMELFEFRKIALFLHRKNRRFFHALEVAKSNKLYQDAIETAAESADPALIEKLLDFFVAEKLQDCFAGCLYACYDYVEPHVVVEKAWTNKMTDVAMPYMIQVLAEMSGKVNRLEKAMSDAQKAAKDAHPAAAANHAGPLMIENFNQGHVNPGFHPTPAPGFH